jgi:amino acid transporter
VLSYREVVSVYTRAGGSYVVARENFGPRVAQVAAVALLIDYIVTVAVQTAAGSVAVVSAFPELTRIPVLGPKILLVISVAAISLMCLGNLRGAREAGRMFAVPTCLFAGSVIAMIVAGLAREVTGDLPHAVPGPGAVGVGSHSGLLAVGALYIMAKAFANGGSSLTGIRQAGGGHHPGLRGRGPDRRTDRGFLRPGHIAGIGPGSRVRLHGTVGIGADGRPAMVNPSYELLR